MLDALPVEVAWSDADLARCLSDGQVRLWWGHTPIDVFTNTTDFHVAAADRTVVHQFAVSEVPFLGCSDVAVWMMRRRRPRERRSFRR